MAMTRREAAAVLGVHRSRIHTLISDGWLCVDDDGLITAHSVEHHKRVRAAGRHRWPPPLDDQRAITATLYAIGLAG